MTSQKIIAKKLIAPDEFANLRFQSGISSLRSQIVTLNNPVGIPAGCGNRKHLPLSLMLATLEKKYDIQFKAVFVAIRELMTPLEPKKKRPIGFAPWAKK